MSDEVKDTTRILESNANMKVQTNVFLLIQDFPRSKIAFLLAVSDSTSEWTQSKKQTKKKQKKYRNYFPDIFRSMCGRDVMVTRLGAFLK